MDIEINAFGKFVKVTGIECEEADDCIETVLQLWESVEKPEPKEPEGITAGSSLHSEREYRRVGFAYLPDGEQVSVK